MYTVESSSAGLRPEREANDSQRPDPRATSVDQPGRESDPVGRYGDAREQLINDVRVLIADTERLLKAVQTESKETIAGVTPRVEAALLRARARVVEMQAELEARARRAARDAETYLHENPWKSAGVAAGAGAALGVVLGALLTKR